MGQAWAGPVAAPAPGLITAARALGPFDELIADRPDTNWTWNESGIGVIPFFWSG